MLVFSLVFLEFLVVFGVSIGAVLLIQAMDIECANPPRRPTAKARRKSTIKAWYFNALEGMR